jgi:SsrA-binding protein
VTTIALNKKASFNYHIHDTMEAGIVLAGWEVKGLRLSKAQITEGHIIIRHGQIFLVGSTIHAPEYASKNIICETQRTRKLLMHKKQILKLEGQAQRASYSIIPLKLYWKKNKVKCEIALVSGKKKYDKRQSLKEKDWNRQKQSLFKKNLS